MSGNPCDACGLESSARVNDVDEGLPKIGFSDFVAVDLEACFGAPLNDGRRSVDYGEAVRFYPNREVSGVGGMDNGSELGAVGALGGSSKVGAGVASAVEGKEDGPS